MMERTGFTGKYHTTEGNGKRYRVDIWTCKNCGKEQTNYFKPRCRCEYKRKLVTSRLYSCNYCGRIGVLPPRRSRGNTKYCLNKICGQAARTDALNLKIEENKGARARVNAKLKEEREKFEGLSDKPRGHNLKNIVGNPVVHDMIDTNSSSYARIYGMMV